MGGRLWAVLLCVLSTDRTPVLLSFVYLRWVCKIERPENSATVVSRSSSPSHSGTSRVSSTRGLGRGTDQSPNTVSSTASVTFTIYLTPFLPLRRLLTITPLPVPRNFSLPVPPHSRCFVLFSLSGSFVPVLFVRVFVRLWKWFGPVGLDRVSAHASSPVHGLRWSDGLTLRVGPWAS